MGIIRTTNKITAGLNLALLLLQAVGGMAAVVKAAKAKPVAPDDAER